MNPLQEMLALQTSLNDKTNGSDWAKGYTKEGRKINWNRCIYMEAIEALDSFNWKHWKDINRDDDWDNLLVELVDIWHFLMSEALARNHPINFVKQTVVKNKAQLILSLEKIAQSALQASINQQKNNQQLIIMLAEFSNTLAHSGLNIDDLYRRYVVKNQLNIFRQNHGYKAGSYQKIWHGKEDNVVAFDLMANQALTPQALYQELEAIYQTVS